MTLEEKLIYFKDNGFKCDELGNVISPKGKLLISKYSNGYYYIAIRRKNIRISMYSHQYIWYYFHNEIPSVIDHINGDPSDNTILNLRNGNQQTNTFNNHKVKGYTYNKNYNKYQSQIMFNYKNIMLGMFNTEEEAHQAYLDAKKIYHII